MQFPPHSAADAPASTGRGQIRPLFGNLMIVMTCGAAEYFDPTGLVSRRHRQDTFETSMS